MRTLIVIKTLAANTVVELLRQKALTLLIIIGILLAAGANYFSQFSFDSEQDFKFIKDYAVGILTLVGVLVAIISTAQILPSELENRTIFTILTKPVQRWEFLLGKFTGICVLLAGLTLMIALVLAVVLYVQETNHINQVQKSYELSKNQGQQPNLEEKKVAIENIRKQSRDSRLIPVFLLTYLKIVLTAAIGLFLSTIATSMMFTAIMTSLLYISGHLVSIARETWANAEGSFSWLVKFFSTTISLIVPDLSAFNLIDEIIAGNPIPTQHTIEIATYGIVYTIVLMTCACLIFSSREL